MKPLLTALALSLTLAAPTYAMSIDMSSLTPVLTYPEPAPEPVSKDAVAVDK